MKITIRDIAKHAGVNVCSTSQVLNNHPKAQTLRPETRQKVLDAAKALGYKRNALAVSVSTGVNKTVALLADFSTTSSYTYMSRTISGLLIEASKEEYGVKLYSSSAWNICEEELISYNIKHVIVLSLQKECRTKAAEFCKKHNINLVYVFEESTGGFPVVSTNDYEMIKAVTIDFAKQGHSRIALICSEHNFKYMKDRHKGYLDGLKTVDIVPNSQFISCFEKTEDTKQAIETMFDLTEDKRPTAFVCIADSHAMHVQNEAIRRGLKMPEDLSIVGFGNDSASQCLIVPLTSLSQPFEDMGRVAIRVLLDKPIDTCSEVDNYYMLPIKLIERDTAKFLNISTKE
jgi:LacI family transcriptional regulator